jgi:hypothetical protein
LLIPENEVDASLTKWLSMFVTISGVGEGISNAMKQSGHSNNLHSTEVIHKDKEFFLFRQVREAVGLLLLPGAD